VIIIKSHNHDPKSSQSTSDHSRSS
jgi:hypothetical protein